MKVTYFQQVPYRHLPPDFAERYESVVSTPYHALTRPEQVADAFQDAMGELMHAARAGFDALVVTEHGQCSYDMVPNPDLLAAALAHATEAEGLSTAIYPLGRSLGKAREPLRVAEEHAVLDCMSRGRLVCGFPIGLGYDANVNNGVPPMETRPRYDENLRLILRSWTAREPFAWNGRHSQHRMVNLWPRPMQDPHPPVWITATGNPRTIEFILESGFGFNYFGWFGARTTAPRIFERFWGTVDALGKPVNPYQVGFMQLIGVAETDEKAEKLYAEHAEYFFQRGLGSVPMERMMLPGGIDIRGVEALLRDPGDTGLYARMRTAPFRDLAETGCAIVGSPDTVAEQLIDIIKRHRIGNLHAMLQFGSMPAELTKFNIDLFAAEVLPRLKGIWRDDAPPHHWWPERLGGDLSPLRAAAGAVTGGLR
ncbi:flavin-dependent oxidoreductase [Streptomyces viridochromogenes]|jgi:alkanesulfonate monooxygenase SsuD/methylene tetrahydromethanopterin reductase-like flavin-dependent oxidoreductase (luciferase family)|uniref:Flavin-dependent oxidoreductase n=1 Tax=Streptomyces viridochromogenes TaxID=1938 RepID=A0A0J8C3J7_STRVR|nr:LLM class flavin-dependent oxidoreductase [Streptomyces viridochromogenes]KMS72380.1 flavin-dependent oxidoreductase [Streptomyces viridochromogenes]KOG16339.1 flavin-dependent oxidoreductase [Streptomyces viridochromogenes]KOG16875.1 flavin-dependent oxidoreductase [Streptomyces viridochromogenes]